MRHPRPFAVVAFAALGVLSLIHCSSPSTGSSAENGAEDADRGNVGLELTLAPGVTVSAASYSINGPNGYTRSGTIDVSQSSTISGQINLIPAGTGYSITLTAISTRGELTCAGQSNFSVAAGQTTTVNVRLYCRPTPMDGGSIIVKGDANVCPFITSMAAWPTTTTVGGRIELTSSAQDLDGQPLTFRWEGAPGFVATTQNASYLCSAPGTYAMRLIVNDGDPSCNDVETIDVVCAPPSGGDPCPIGSPNTAACLACEANQCPHDAYGCGTAAGCSAQPACADYATPAERQACELVLGCIHRTNCNTFGTVSCYCGQAVDLVTCKEASTTASPALTGVCKNEIAAGFAGSVTPKDIVNSFYDVRRPSGGAISLAECDWSYCGSPALGGNNECVPYCR